MSVFEIELTEREWEIYSLPINFERAIGDTVYTVNATLTKPQMKL